jgi:eukaryotic-like serine/threonine-protein kinase
MALAPGTRLGAYEIVSLLGQGGMGEVYRAKDTKLGRDVALKILPDAFTTDPDRLARFRREAQVLASLNHPHIGAIYGLDDANGQQFLVLELVDGESLDKRIARGKIPVDEALTIVKQIAEALEAAHEKGIIHRDLKPANIALTRDGNVKVLDFGLAKAMEPASGTSLDPANSPTITSPAMMTGIGMILGTAAYMSPEQAKGRPADKRSDVWAFGCVLYEMVAGKRAFDGDDPTEVIAAVIRGEPDWKALTVDVPEHVRLLIRRCLEKDRGKRISDISTARFVILESETFSMPRMASGGSARAAWSSRRRRMTLALVAAISASALTGAIVWQLKPAPAQLPVTRFIVQLPAEQQFTNTGRKIVAISPDGTKLVYVANSRLYLKAIDRPQATAISGTEAPGVGPSGVTNLSGVTSPVFSPDGRSIAFYSAADRALKRISTTGGTAVTLCRASNPFALSWDGDAILYTTIQGIMRVPENGGSPEALATLGVSEQADTLELLPGGRILLYTVANRVSPDRWDKAQVVVQAIGSHERTVVIDGGSDAHYLPTGHIVYAVSGVLFAVPFNLQRLKVTGGAVSVVEGVRRSSNLLTGVAQYAVSRTGTLMFAAGVSGSGLTPGDLALVDQEGTTEPLKLEPRRYFFPRFSPDGQRIAIQIDDVKESNIWIYDLAARSPIYRLTFGGNNRFPVWTPDGSRVAFQSDREGDAAIFWQRADTPGNAERLIKPDKGQAVVPNAFSPAGEAFLYTASDGASRFLWVYSQRERKATRFDDVVSIGLPNATFSPDGKWVAYEVSSALNAGVDVFVQPFPATGEKVQIGAGRYPMWSRDERRLYYFAGVGTDFGVVDYTDRPTFKVVGKLSGWPRSGAILMPVAPRNYDLAPDGKHFLIVVEAGGPAEASDSSRQIQVVANWFEELKARMPAK